jgi:ParB family chromosome partitioning protein
MFVPDYPTGKARPASYNPRAITPESRAALQASIREFGFIRPVVVTAGGTLIAGHQRSDTAAAMGMATVPACVVPDMPLEDEIRFNQIHNGADWEITDADIRVPASDAVGWEEVPRADVRVLSRPRHAAKLIEVTKLVAKFGTWGASVAAPDGRVIVCQLYALACVTLGLPLRVRRIPAAHVAGVVKAFRARYGEFHYGRLPPTPWTQSLVQPFRLRGASGEQKGRSRLYDNLVVPSLKRGDRVIDFGAGQQDYARRLRAQGFDVLAVEFYLRRPGSMTLDMPRIRRDVDAVLGSLRERGRFDVVVCDFVLNSVASVQAEADVLLALSALCRPGGRVHIATRSREHMDYQGEHTRNVRDKAPRSYLTFIDRNGFHAQYARGVWQYQKYHTIEQAGDLIRRFIGEPQGLAKVGGAIIATAANTAEHPAAVVEAALDREFSLPLPGGKSHGRGADAVAAWRAACALDRQSTVG